jgi:hypothetical protein
MKKIKFIAAVVVLVALVASCGGRKDRCPSVGKVISAEATFIA